MNHNPSLALHKRVSAFGRARVYEVGGSVRDRLLGLPGKDHDYVITGLPADAFPTVFMCDKIDYVGQSFGVYKIQLREFGEPITPVLDVALPRTEHSTGPGHREFAVTSDPTLSIEADLGRRDFTFNAMAWDIAEQELIDPYGGQQDLMNRELRFVGDAAARVTEDPVRVLRAFRFMVKLFLKPPRGETLEALQRGAPLLQGVAPERVFGELWGLLSYQEASPHALARALYAMLQAGVLQQIIPAYAQAQFYDQGSPYHHLPLADHMLESVSYAQHLGASPITKLALLLHDLGKPATRSEGEDGRAHYFGHEDLGAQMATNVLLRDLRAPREVSECVSTLITHHMRLSPRQELGDRGLRRFMHDLGPLWRDSLDHRCADLLAHAPDIHEGSEVMHWHAELRRRGQELETRTQISALSERTLALSGTEIMTLLNLGEGHEIGVVKRRLLQAVIDGEVENEKEALVARLKEMYVGPA